MSLVYKIEELHPEIRRVITEHNIDTGPNDAPDGRITELDLPRIDATIAELEKVGGANAARDIALLRSLRPATSDGLAVPRPEVIASHVRDALAKGIPGEAVEALTAEDLRSATLQERVAMVRAIIDHPGYMWGTGWWQGMVTNPRERRILEILTTTPDHQRGALMQELHKSPALFANMESAIDGNESVQFHAWLSQNIYRIPSPTDTASILIQTGIRNESELITHIRQLREHRGDAFANEVLSQLLGMPVIQRLLPYVWWIAPTPNCDSENAILGELAYQGTLEVQRQLNATHLRQLLSNFPPGSAAAMVQEQFDQHNNIARIVAGANIGVCVAQALARKAERAREAERDRVRELERQRAPEPRTNPIPGGGNALPGGTATPQHHDDPPAERRAPPGRLGAGSGRDAGIQTDAATRGQKRAEPTAPAPERKAPARLGASSGRDTGGIKIGPSAKPATTKSK